MLVADGKTEGVPSVGDPNDPNDFSRCVEIMNMAQGYGSEFNYKTAQDKAIIEEMTCCEWCRSIKGEFSLAMGEPKHNPNDPPDCYVTFEGKRLGVELVQLVEPEHKQRAVKGESPYGGQLFEDMQWMKERFISRLNQLSQSKGEKYRKRGQRIDVLVVHTAEPYLTISQARDWLTDAILDQHPFISSAFLLFGYAPGGTQHWPVFWLYGDLGGAAFDT